MALGELRCCDGAQYTRPTPGAYLEGVMIIHVFFRTSGKQHWQQIAAPFGS